jgi:hypothetical protein
MFEPFTKISEVKNIPEYPMIFIYREYMAELEIFRKEDFLKLQKENPDLAPFFIEIKDLKKDFEEMQKKKSPAIPNNK